MSVLSLAQVLSEIKKEKAAPAIEAKANQIVDLIAKGSGGFRAEDAAEKLLALDTPQCTQVMRLVVDVFQSVRFPEARRTSLLDTARAAAGGTCSVKRS